MVRSGSVGMGSLIKPVAGWLSDLGLSKGGSGSGWRKRLGTVRAGAKLPTGLLVNP